MILEKAYVSEARTLGFYDWMSYFLAYSLRRRPFGNAGSWGITNGSCSYSDVAANGDNAASGNGALPGELVPWALRLAGHARVEGG